MIGLRRSPSTVKVIPPVSSHLHATINTPNKINDGIRWMRNPMICCEIVNSASKASNANMLMNKMAKRHIILADQ